jgi:hypothetical protein
MSRRLLAFALAFMIVGGPIAADVCEAACAGHAEHAIDATMPPSHQHHHGAVINQPSLHHHSDVVPPAATQSARFLVRWHGCDHLEGIVAESRNPTPAPVATADVTEARVAPPLIPVLPSSRADNRHGPPASIRSTAPLRL